MEKHISPKRKFSFFWKRLFSVHKYKKERQKDSNTKIDSSHDKESHSYHTILYESAENADVHTILKKSCTNPSRLQMSNCRHTTFKEVVKVHEYVMHDTLENEEHYTSEASLTDDDEVHEIKRKHKFYLDVFPGESSEENLSDIEQTVPCLENVQKDQNEPCQEESYLSPKSEDKPQIKKKSQNKKLKLDENSLVFDFVC